jgi:hypothetical protein
MRPVDVLGLDLEVGNEVWITERELDLDPRGERVVELGV